MRTAIGAMFLAVWPLCPAGVQAADAIEAPAVTIRIHDYAQVPPAMLREVQALVAGYYDAIGVRTAWADTFVRGQRPDGTPRASIEDLTVIVLTERMSRRRRGSLSTAAMGFAAVGKSVPGRIAYVIYDRIDLAAGDIAWGITDLMSVVMAHEIGHLLLPSGSHSDGGLMRGDWNLADLRQTNRRRLQFTQHQGELIREALGVEQGGSKRGE